LRQCGYEAVREQRLDGIQEGRTMNDERQREQDERPDSYADAVEQQAEFEELEREKGDDQEAVDAVRRGEKPREDPKNVSSA
jgi:hypothetical protein